jgi:hypothetical protein
MPRREDPYWNTTLPEGSDALADLDAFRKEWGNITRNDATRMLLIAWSKARRGQFNSLWGMSGGNTPSPPEEKSEPAQPPTAACESTPPATPPVTKRRTGNGNAAAAPLDLS